MTDQFTYRGYEISINEFAYIARIHGDKSKEFCITNLDDCDESNDYCSTLKEAIDLINSKNLKQK